MRFKVPPHFREFIQFIMVGGMNAVLDIGSLNIILLIWPTTDDRLLIIYNSLAYLLAIINSYFWNSRLTFRSYAQKDIREKTYFFIQAAISLIISNLTFLGTIHVLMDFRLSVWVIQNISKVLAMAIPSLASFLFMKYFVFRKLKSDG